MAKFLLIFAALITAVTAYLGVATKQKVGVLQEEMAKARTDLTATRSDLSKTKTTLKKAEEDLTTANSTLEERDKELTTRKAEVADLTTKLANMPAEIEAKDKQIADITVKLEALSAGGTVNAEEITAKNTELMTAKARLETEKAELQQVVDTSNARLKEVQEQVTSRERQVQEYKQNFVRTGLTGTVLAYNPGWNFVVLSIGDRQGLKANTSMVVTRSGQMVAKVRVTSVEPSTSIADIVPGSMPRGSNVQAGDSVVYEGRK